MNQNGITFRSWVLLFFKYKGRELEIATGKDKPIWLSSLSRGFFVDRWPSVEANQGIQIPFPIGFLIFFGPGRI